MNASSSSYSLQITIISGESITKPSSKKHLTKNLCVKIWPENNSNQILPKELHRQTMICEDNNYYPAWNNEKLVINNVPMHVKFFVLEVLYVKSSSSNYSIGFARVPVSDFIDSSMPLDYLHFLSYRLRDRLGRRNGIINFSVQVLEGKESEFDRVLRRNSDLCDGNKYGGLREVNGVANAWSVGSGTTPAVGVPTAVWYNSCHAN